MVKSMRAPSEDSELEDDTAETTSAGDGRELTPDDLLMIRIQEGDQKAFDELVHRHQKRLFYFFLDNLRDPHLAEDLAQETLLKVYNQSWDYLPLGRFTSWMYRVARNLLIDDYRKRSHDALLHCRRPSEDDGDNFLGGVADDLSLPEEYAHKSEEQKKIHLLMQQLPDDQRQTLTLHYFGNLKLHEIAELMEANLATTKSRLRLAREKLKSLLEREGLDGS
jgi:RNA polymerase sigma-70 factor (ECF subfamily)